MGSHATPINVTLGGLSLNLNATASATAASLSGVAIPKETRHALPRFDLNKLKEKIVAPNQLKDGQLLNHEAVSDQTSLDEVYDKTQVLNQVKQVFKYHDMLTPFTIQVPVKDATTGAILGQAPTGEIDMFEGHSKVTYEQVVDSNEFLLTWIYDETVNTRKWVLSDLIWGGEFLFNQMSPALMAAIKDDIKDKGVPEKHAETGTVVLKALIDRMLNSNYNALSLLRAGLERGKVSLDLFDGDIEEFAKKYVTVIERLKKCEERDAAGNLIGKEHVPRDLTETLFLELIKTGHTQFDLIFNTQYAECKRLSSKGTANPYPTPESVLQEARQLFVDFRRHGDWDKLPGDNRNPSGFNAAAKTGKPQGQCFGCGRVGCRKTDKNCPRFGKEPSAEGAKAKVAFDEAKKKKQGDKKKAGGDTKKKWPAKPGKSDPKRQKIDGSWHYYHFKSKKWLKCDDQTDAGNQKAIEDSKAKANEQKQVQTASTDTPAGTLPAGLASLIAGRETTQSIRLKTELYNAAVKKAEAEFKNGL